MRREGYSLYEYMEKFCTLKVCKVYIYVHILIRMDAPNAPNPANPNEQYQNTDAVQGSTNQAQGPAEQNQAQVPPAQIPIQVPVAQVPI